MNMYPLYALTVYIHHRTGKEGRCINLDSATAVVSQAYLFRILKNTQYAHTHTRTIQQVKMVDASIWTQPRP